MCCIDHNACIGEEVVRHDYQCGRVDNLRFILNGDLAPGGACNTTEVLWYRCVVSISAVETIPSSPVHLHHHHHHHLYSHSCYCLPSGIVGITHRPFTRRLPLVQFIITSHRGRPLLPIRHRDPIVSISASLYNNLDVAVTIYSSSQSCQRRSVRTV